jgi:MraZ protein
MLLTGTYERNLDEKLRVALPKRFRDLTATKDEPLFLVPGTDGSLALYPGPAFARLADRLASQSPTAQDVRAFGRLLYAQSQSVELDRQGRFRVPPELARHAELARQCVLIGAGDHMELWNKERWEAYLADLQPRYDQLAESALSGGVSARSATAAATAAVTEPGNGAQEAIGERPMLPR